MTLIYARALLTVGMQKGRVEHHLERVEGVVGWLVSVVLADNAIARMTHE